jgi:hypothetical protein
MSELSYEKAIPRQIVSGTRKSIEKFGSAAAQRSLSPRNDSSAVMGSDLRQIDGIASWSLFDISSRIT